MTPIDMIEAYNENVELGIPSGEGFSEFLEGFSKDLSTFARRVTGSETYAIVNTPSGDNIAVKRLEAMGLIKSKSAVVIAVEPLTDYLDVVIDTISKQLESIGDIETRLYTPLVRQFSRLISQPEAYDKAWVDEKVEFRDVEKMRKELAKLFTRRKPTNGNTEEASFSDLYRSIKNFSEVTEKLTQLKDFGLTINMVSLKKTEDRLVELVNEFIEIHEGGETRVMKDGVKKSLIQAIRATGEETEYLSLLLYYANIFIVAHNDSMGRIINS